MSRHTLLLVRHAKAVHDDGGGDHDRGLTERGRADARALGDLLAGEGLVPDLAVCSDAARAVQTWQQAASRLPGDPPVREDGRLYGASVRTVVEVLASLPEDAGTVAVVGHEPTTSAAAAALAGDGSAPASRRRLGTGLPTAAVAVLTCDVEWSALAPDVAALVAVNAPRAG